MDVARLGARLILQTGLEAEVTELFGRERDACGDRARPGSRNGSRDVTVTTTAGPFTLARPKRRGTDEAFASRLLGRHVTHAGALASLTIAGYVRGLSTRDVEASLADALGARGGAIDVDGFAGVCGHQNRIRQLGGRATGPRSTSSTSTGSSARSGVRV